MSATQLANASLIDRAMGAGRCLVAFSGGGDSTALLHAAIERCGARAVTALNIDHARRPASKQESQTALAYAQSLGVDARIVTLNWSAEASPGQAALRRARYRALCDAARALGVDTILLGHTADDQAETFILRAADGSGWRGLAGMRALAPAPLWPEGEGLWIARPLLEARRAALRAWLSARGAPWLEDPSNENRDYARVRARALLSELESVGFDAQRFIAAADRLRRFADDLDAQAAALIADHALFEGPQIRLAHAGAEGLAGARALGVLIAAVSGSESTPDLDAAEALRARLGADGAATLAGAVARRHGETILLSRDLGALYGRADGAAPLAPLNLPAGRREIWDGRLALTADAPGWRAELDPGRSAGPLLKGPDPAASGPASVRQDWLLRRRALALLGSVPGRAPERRPKRRAIENQ